MSSWRDIGATRLAALIVGTCAIFAAGVSLAWLFPYGQVAYPNQPETASASAPTPEPVAHIPTPGSVKGIYMTACTASEKKLRDKTLAYFDGTVLNSLVIDFKDYTGTVAYVSTSTQFNEVSASSSVSKIKAMLQSEQSGPGCLIPDLPGFLAELHGKGIYAIARITVFQDPSYSKLHPDLSVMSKANPNRSWRDRSGLSYIDPGATPYWDYIVSIGKEAYGIGFDELNFDYIRYPSDGNMSDAAYPWSGSDPKDKVMSDFFLYLRAQLASTGAPLSADLFGLTTSTTGDMGIGQVLGDALSYFDYVAPMVYPSHFADGFIGFANPANHPYDVVRYSMDHAVVKAAAASSTPDKLRPWLQDFDLGATYTTAMVKDEIKAVNDSGLTSWLLWDAASVYHKDAVVNSY